MTNKNSMKTLCAAGALAVALGGAALFSQTPTQAGSASMHPGHFQVRDYNNNNYNGNGNGNGNNGRHNGGYYHQDPNHDQKIARLEAGVSKLQEAQSIVSGVQGESEFQGHRMKALEAIRRAISELKTAEHLDRH